MTSIDFLQEPDLRVFGTADGLLRAPLGVPPVVASSDIFAALAEF